jgi:hypothetical protein
MLSVVWAVCVSMWFFQHVPEVNAPGIASVYLQCIREPNAKQRECRAKAEWFGEEARSRSRAGCAVGGAGSNPGCVATHLCPCVDGALD